MKPIDEKVVFMVSVTEDGVPLVIFGIPRPAFERMADGKTSTFDLTSVGVPVRMSCFGGESYEDCMKTLEAAAAASGTIIDKRENKDFGIHFPEKK